MNTVYGKIEKCVESIRKITDFNPRVALVLGSGLGNYAEEIEICGEVPYSSIEGFPVSTVSGHDGKFLFGYVSDVPVVCMKGRVHYYEGYSMEEVVLPIRVMKSLGAEILFLTNAAGGVNEEFEPGDLMLIKDHIAVFIENPLIGQNEDRLGCRFPDMSRVYDVQLQEIIKKAAEDCGIGLKEGVYTQLSGPSYETPAEVRMLKVLGTDAVGMSTVVEAIAANHMGMKICGISCITNMAAGFGAGKLNHAEVKETADRVSMNFSRIVTEAVKNFRGIA